MRSGSFFLFYIVIILIMFCLGGCEAKDKSGKGTEQAQEKLDSKSVKKEPLLPFAIIRDKVEGDNIIGRYIYSCKKGHHFVIVATTEMNKGKRITDSEMNHVLLDDSNREYKPIAFGLPAVTSDQPFMIMGFSYEGGIENVDTEKTIFALFFLTPIESKPTSVRKPDGKTKRLVVLDHYEPSNSMRISGYQMYGSLNFGTPTIKKNGWGLKIAEND